MKKVLIFPGSQRVSSLNIRLAKQISGMLQAEIRIDFLQPDEVDLPIFNQDIERHTETIDKVYSIYQRFHQADGFLVASPEYNGSVSPYLKNTIDWVSRLQRISPDQFTNPLQEKPLLLASAAAGSSGGILGLQAARQIFTYLGCMVLAEQICVPRAYMAWNDDGIIEDPDLAAWIDHAIYRFCTVLKSSTKPSI